MAEALALLLNIVTVIKFSNEVAEYLKGVKGGSEDRRNLRDEIRNACSYLEMLKDRLEDSDIDENWSRPLASLLSQEDGPLAQYKRILELVIGKLVPTSRLKQKVQPLRWPFEKTEVMAHISRIERLKSLFMLARQEDLT